MSSPSGHVTVIIPARDAAGTVGAAVTALVSGTRRPDAILVVDDGSKDGTGEVARAAGATVVTQAHSGPGQARAAGVRAAPAVRDPMSAVYVFTDADCVAEPDFLELLVAPLLGGQAHATKGAYRTDQRSLVSRFTQVEFEERYRRLAGRDGTDFADGHAAAYRRRDFEEAGGFDTRLRLSQNVDLAYRLAEAGKRISFVPAALVTHRHPTTIGRYARAKLERSFWRATSLWRHPGKAWADSYTPWSLKFQMALVVSLPLVMIGLATGSLSPDAAARAAGLLVVAFCASALPLLHMAWQKDRPVLAVAIPMLAVRAVALSVGTACGLIAGALPERRPERGLSAPIASRHKGA